MKYGLQLRVPPSQQKKAQTKPPLPTLSIFNDDDDDDVKGEMCRQALKHKTDVNEKHQRALEEDPSAFDYDGVYDAMKEMDDCQERKPKYIPSIMQRTKERHRENEIMYDKTLAKKRSKDDHLFADEGKFITKPYKEKLAEDKKWLEEDCLRQLQEEKDDVTKKGDMSDFHFLSKKVVFGAQEKGSRIRKQQIGQGRAQSSADVPLQEMPREESLNQALFQGQVEHHLEKSKLPNGRQESVSSEVTGIPNQDDVSEFVATKVAGSSKQENVTEPVTKQPDRHKRQQDAVAAATERFLARKKEKGEQVHLVIPC